MVNDVKVENKETNNNKVVTDKYAVIKEEPDIKIEDREVGANYLINSTRTSNRGCIKLEDTTTGVTDVMVHDNVPVSDSLQANDLDYVAILHQPGEAYAKTGELINDVKVEYNDGKVEEVYIKTEGCADGTSGGITDPIHIEADGSPHVPIHSEENVSLSDSDNNGCNTSSDLTEGKLTGIDKVAYVCDICNKKFPSRGKLLRHKKTYSGETPHVCEICYKNFRAKDNLIKHKRLHTGEKPYVCDVCNKSFAQNGSLVKHKRIHTGEKPYVCEVCKKGFYASGDLTVHKRIHTGEKPYTCEACHKGFTNNSDLIKHKRIHTGEKPYVCEICNKKFSQKTSLVSHKYMHSGVKPYVCEVCNKGFGDKQNFVRHKRIHTYSFP